MSRCVLAGLLSVLIASPSVAQSTTVFTEAQFLLVLDASHPVMAESSEALAMARADEVAASTLENPELGVLREDPSGVGQQIEWTVSWQVPPASRRLGIAAHREGVIAAEAGLAREVLAHRLEMRRVYAAWAIAAARGDRLAAQVEHMAALADREQKRVEGGESAGLVARRLLLAVAGLRAQFALASSAEEDAVSLVRSWFPALARTARPRLPSLDSVPSFDTDHPEMRAAEAELRAAKLQRGVAGRFVRSPGLTAGWQAQDLGPESMDGPILGITWSVPLFGRNQAERMAAEARVAAAEARLKLAGDALGARRTGILANFQRLTSALAEAQDAATGNQQILLAAEATFRLGESSLTDLLDTRRAVTETEMMVLDLYEAALAAHRELEQLAGVTSEPESRAPSSAGPLN